MVSLSRLLTAADDSPLEEPAAIPLSTRLPRDCVLPPVLPLETVPARLSQIESARPPQPSQPTSSSGPLLSSLRPPPLLPLQALLLDLGPEATAPANMSSLARTLAQFGRPSEPAVASALLFLATAVPADTASIDSQTLFQLFALFCGDSEKTGVEHAVQHSLAATGSSPSEWRASTLVQAVTTVANQFNAPLDWRLVIRSLDVEGLEKQLNQSAFVEIANAFITGTNGSLLPADCLMGSWQNAPAQLCMISYALKSPKLMNWEVLDTFVSATAEDCESPYARVALVEKLIELDARDLLQVAVKESTDVLLLSLSCSKPHTNALLQQKLTLTLLSSLIALFPSSEKRLRQIWHVSPSLVITAIVGMWKEEPSILRKSLEIGIHMAILPDLLSSGTSIEFSLELAMLAYQEDVLKFESWLMELLRSCGLESISTLTIYMARKVRRSDPDTTGHLSLDALRIVFRSLITSVRALSSPQTQELMDAVQNVFDTYCKLDSRIADLSPSMDTGNPKILFASELVPVAQTASIPQQAAPMTATKGEGTGNSEAASTAASMLLPVPTANDSGSSSFPATVEKEADIYFGRLYKGEMPPDAAVDILRRLKASNSEHDRQVFNCTVHTLFDEYRFFKKYPDRELKITGVLFGSVVQYSLLVGTLLGLAAKCVLDALRTVEPAPLPIGRLVKFGLVALERFKVRLHEWPQYCSSVLELQRLKELAPELIADVQKALDMNGAVIPSAAEKKIGLSGVEKDTRNGSLLAVGGSAPATAAFRDISAEATSVRALVSSPPMSSSNTPVRGRSISSNSLRSSPTMGVDRSLGMSPLDLPNLLNMSNEEASHVTPPDEGTQDKIKFIFNNLSQSTMEDKVREMLSILAPEHYRFFAVYIVVKRASMESNFHHLYLAMLGKMEPRIPSLFPMVFQMTYRRVKVLLAGDKSTASTDRTILKSLGSWIGALTLHRNKPILRRDLDLKEALMDAYSNGRLTTVIPFVVKVLEHCHESKIFKTTNPWVRGVLSLMKEIYGVEDLKLNMKFELQILSKYLGIDVDSIKPSDLLRSRPAPDKTDNPDFATKKSLSSSPLRGSPSPVASPSPELRRPFVSQGVGARTGAPLFSLADSHAAQSTVQASVAGPPSSSARLDMPPSLVQTSLSAMRGDPVSDLSSILASTSISSNPVTTAQNQRSALHASMGMGAVHTGGTSHRQTGNMAPNETLIPNLAQYITVSPSLVLFQTSPNLKRMIPLAIDRAIREIIQPVVERSCAIAFLTTKELTLKDFSLEPDMAKIRRAALQMVQQLAGSLALVTSKEPLRVSMGNQLRTILAPSVVADQTLVEQTAQIVCASNLEIGCAIIEKRAKEKAARDLNEKIGPTFAARRSQQTAYNYGLPPGPEVFRVYDEFARINRNGLPTPYNASTVAPVSTSQSMHPTTIANPAAVPPVSGSISTASTRIVQPVADLRSNGSMLESKVDGRTQVSQNSIRLAAPAQVRPDAANQGVVGSRRPTSNQTVTDVSAKSAVCGTILPPMAAPTSLAPVMMAAAGASGANGGTNTHGLSGSSGVGSALGEEALSTQQVLERFNLIYPQVVKLISEIASTSPSGDVALVDVPSDHELSTLWIQIPAAVKRSVTADEAGMAVAQKLFQRLYEGDSSLYREIHVLLLEGLRESCRRLSKELSSWLAYSEDRKKLHRECIIALLKPGSLLNKTSYDEIVAKAIDNGRNITALEFACFLVKRAVIDEPLATAAELYLTLEAMAKVGRRSNETPLKSAPDGLIALVDAARSVEHKSVAPSSSTGGNSDTHHPNSNRQPREVDHVDPIGAKEFVANLLLEWHRILGNDSPGRRLPEHVVANFLDQLRSNVLTTDEAKERFFRIAVELTVTVTSMALHAKGETTRVTEDLIHFPYTPIEAVIRLTGALSRREAGSSADGIVRSIGTISQFIIAVAKEVLKSAAGADLRAHFRLFSGLIGELAIGANLKDKTTGDAANQEPDPISTACAERLGYISSKTESYSFLDDETNGFSSCVRKAGMGGRGDAGVSLDNYQVITAIVCGFSACAPALVPGFAFSWLQLISNKELLPSLLSLSNVNGWPLFRHLLVSMLEFLASFLQDAQQPLKGAVKVLYSGMLRVLLVLLHDFPEVLCSYHMSFCDVIPQNCVQLRNLVLASFPRDMRLPDPFLPELNVDELPDMLRPPIILNDFTAPLEKIGLKPVVDNYLQSAASFRGTKPRLQLESYLIKTDDRNDVKEYNVQSISALVLYLGQLTVSRSASGQIAGASGAATDVFRALTDELGPEGRNYLFNAIANQLRYPNNNTMYYSNLLLLLFREASHDSVKEQITRVLVERLIANRPHPWGLLTTFVQLIKNAEYNFWGHGFVRCAPEIEQLFENVAKFCVGPVLQNKHQSIVAAT